MKKLTLTLTLLSIFALALPSYAQRGRTSTEQLVLKLNDAHYRGSSVIQLKQQIRQQYPRMILRNFKLKRVKLVAKSKQGRGSAELMVGQSSQDRGNIAGSPREFHSSKAYTFDRVALNNYSGRQGAWQIHLQGNIIVRKVVVVLESEFRDMPRRPGPRRPGQLSFIDIGTQRFDKLVDETETVQINQRSVYEISITGDGKVDVKQAVVVFRNGRRERLFRLEGTIYDGQTKTAFIDGRNVESLKILGTSPNVFGSRGKIKAEVGVRY